MKYLSGLLFLHLFIATFSLNATNNEKEIKSEITEVSVFLNGAMVTRSANTTIPAGYTMLLFKGVSSKISKQTIKADISQQVKVLSVEYLSKSITKGKQDSLKIKSLRDSINNILKEIRKIEYQREVYEAEKQAIEQNNILIKGSTNAMMQVAELQKLSDLYRIRYTEIGKQLYLLNESKINLENKKKHTEQSIDTLKSVTKISTSYVIQVLVKSNDAVAANIKLSYVAGGLAWAPKYDIRVEGVDNKINIDYLANIINESGEDWNNVKVKLSTADPLQSANLPSLKPWTLNYSQAYSNGINEGRLNDYSPKKLALSEAQQNSGGIELPKGVSFEEVEVPAIAIEFDIKDLQTIPSDGKPYLLDVTTYNLNATFEYYAVPKVDKAAFLLAQIVGWEKLNLMEGATSIYFRGTFVGSSYIKPEYANDTLDISLGRDNKVMINRVKVEDKDDQKFIGTNKREKLTYRIAIRNTNATPVKLTFIDQVPVSQEGDIEVNILETTGGELDKLSGQLKYDVSLAPSEAKEFTISFEVKYPKNKPIKVSKNSNISNRKARSKF
jgi:uncharacterized protein (TIGR02231 family)